MAPIADHFRDFLQTLINDGYSPSGVSLAVASEGEELILLNLIHPSLGDDFEKVLMLDIIETATNRIMAIESQKSSELD
jgi:hypothetical protein